MGDRRATTGGPTRTAASSQMFQGLKNNFSGLENQIFKA